MTSIIKILILGSLLLPLPLIASEAVNAVPNVPDVMGGGNILQIIVGLFVVLMVIFGAAWILKRYGGFGGMTNSNLKVVAGITVGQREKIVVVQVGEVQLLVGISPGNIRTLHVLEQHIDAGQQLKTAEVEVENNSSSVFINHLKQQVEKKVKS